MIATISKVDMLTISCARGFDPIRVYMEQIGEGKGRITITHAREAWVAGWSAMGNYDVAHFVATQGAKYLQESLLEGLEVRPTYYQRKRVMEIVTVVQRALHKEFANERI